MIARAVKTSRFRERSHNEPPYKRLNNKKPLRDLADDILRGEDDGNG